MSKVPNALGGNNLSSPAGKSQLDKPKDRADVLLHSCGPARSMHPANLQLSKRQEYNHTPMRAPYNKGGHRFETI